MVSFAFVGISFLMPLEASPAVSFDMVEIFAPKPLAVKSMDLTNRYPDKWVNDVFSDNILLTLHYLKDPAFAKASAFVETSADKSAGEWNKVRQPFEIEFILMPGEVFAFQDNLLPEFENKVVKTTNAHFNFDDGFKSDGYLIGDGVCHLASLINWVASEAGLKVVAKVNHDFRSVPGIPGEFGTSIMWTPDNSRGSSSQNLYLENTFDYPVKFVFKADAQTVSLAIFKDQW